MNAIEFCKSRLQTGETFLLIKGDDQAQRILVAWSAKYPKRDKWWDVDPKKADAVSELDKMWREILPAIDFHDLSKRADVPQSKVETLFFRMRHGFLIWPDGSVSDIARKALIGEAEGYIKGLIRKSTMGA